MSGERLSRAERRTRILDAAEVVFAEEGYTRAGMRGIASRAGITTPVLYDHFSSKAELYAVLLERQVDALIAAWSPPPDPGGKQAPPDPGGQETPPEPGEQDTLSAPPDVRELFHGRVRAIYAWIEHNEAAWRMIFGESPADETVALAHRRSQARATAHLAGLFRRVPRLDLSVDLERDRAEELLAEAAKSALNAMAAWWWRNRDVPRDHVMALTSDLLWRGLGALTGDEGEDHEQS